MWDILVILAIFLFAFNGWRRGLILSIFSIVGYFISLIVARILSPKITEYIMINTGIAKWMDNFLGDQIRSAAQINIATNMITDVATKTIISVICFFIIFSITSFIIFRIGKLANRVGKLPFIGGINKVGGLVFGTIKGLLLIFIILALLSFIVSTGSEQLEATIEDTRLVKLMYENNPIIYLISEILEAKNTPSSKIYVNRSQSVFLFFEII